MAIKAPTVESWDSYKKEIVKRTKTMESIHLYRQWNPKMNNIDIYSYICYHIHLSDFLNIIK